MVLINLPSYYKYIKEIMKLLNDLHLFAESREEKTLAKIRKHVETTYETVKSLEKAFEAFEKGDEKGLREKYEQVDSLEKKADMLRREIEEELYSGAFLPISRSRILDFAENVDKVADAAEDASKILPFLNKEHVTEELLRLLEGGIGKSLDCLKLLMEGVDEIEDLEAVKKIIKEIRLKEHESDEITYKAQEIVYNQEHDAIVLHLLARLIDLIDKVSDTAEDASDSLSLIVLMHKI